MKIFEKIGYRESLLGAFSFLIITIIFCLFVYISINQKIIIKETTNKSLQLYTNILKSINTVTISDSTRIYSYFDNLVEKEKAFLGIRIYSNKKLIYEKLPESKNSYIIPIKSIEELKKINSEITKEVQKDLYEIIFPIDNADTLKFYVQFGIDLKEYQYQFDYYKDYYIIVLIGALIIATILSFYMGNSFDRKIKKLLNYTQGIADGNLNLKIDFNSGDEFGQLADACNTMVNKLVNSHNKLRSYQFSLEETIAQQNKSLYESEEKYRNLVEASHVVIFIIQNGRIVFTNSRVNELFGIKPEDIIDCLIDEIKFLSEQDRKNLLQNLDRISPIDTKVYNYEFKGIGKNNKELILEFSVHRIQHNLKDAFQAVIWDITERKKFENELLQLQKMESIGTLASGIAHDFNNILGVIIPNSEMIKKTALPSSDIYHDAEQIEKAALRASDVTSKLLSFARKDEIKVEVIHPNQIIENIIKFITRVLDKKINIKTVLNPDIKNIEVDSNQIEQVLLNIVINAKDAMPDGGELIIKTDKVTNDVIVLDSNMNKSYNDYIKIEISDTGIGMDEETQKRIFEPFFTTKKPGHGTGLGLSSSYGIIKNHKGILKVHSRVNEGTTFTVILPGTSEKVVKKDETVLTFKQGKGLILIIEDDVMMMETLKNLIEHLGFDVITAENGYEGCKLYMEKRQYIKLAIVDMEMPGKNGLETLKDLRNINPKINVIISSGYSKEGNVQVALENGARSFLKKPYRLKELSKTIFTALDKTS